MSYSRQDNSRRLCCYIEGESDVFPVTVNLRTCVVGELKKVIQSRRALGILKEVNAHTLELWKPKDSNPIAAEPANTLVERIISRGASLSKFADKLGSMNNLFTIFPTPPKDPVCIDIIVKVPVTAIQQKRALSEEDRHRTKRAKIVMFGPSSTGRPDVYEALQREPAEMIFDDRPDPDFNIPSVALLYKGFGHFLDIMDGRNDVPGLADIDIIKLYREVDRFANRMNTNYGNDNDRRDAALPCLTYIFSARRGIQIPPFSAAAIGAARSDGHNTAPHRAATLVAKLKNRIVGISSIPQIELACYVARLNAVAMEDHLQLFQRWRVPCLGLTIVGSELTFYAIIKIGHQLKVISLTPTFSCIESACDGRDRKSLYLAFTAASVLQAHILQDIETLLKSPPSGPILCYDRCFPTISRLHKYPPSSDNFFDFDICSLFPDPRPTRLLYFAETPDKETVIIKFTRQYSIELHDFCAKLGHAPQIFAFERLPGGWYAIAMEYIESGVPITYSTPAHRGRWTKQLEDVVAKFHSEGFVHGDLRDANILCKGDLMTIIDFDWGGKDGEVFYPTANLNHELLEGRVSDNLTITKVDDTRVLRKTLAKLLDPSTKPQSSYIQLHHVSCRD